MADTKISALTDRGTPAASDLLVVVDNPGTSQKKIALDVLGRYLSKGASTRTVAAANASSRNKIAADYVCDGTADEVQINQAISDVATFGGKVLLTEGTFTLATPVVINQHGIILEGAGWGDPVGQTEDSYGTTLYPAAGFTGGALIVAATGTFGTSNPVAACQISNLMCDGSGGTITPIGTGIDGIQFSSFSGLIENVRTVYMSGDGVHVSGKTTASTWSTYDTSIVGLLTHKNTGKGLFLDQFAEDIQLLRIVSHNNGDDGVACDGSSNQFLDCHLYDNGAGTGYNMDIGSGAARVKVVGSKIEHAEGIGIRNAGWETLFSSNNFHNNGDPSGGAGTRHLLLTGGSVLVVGNRFGIKNSTYSMGNAIEIQSGATGCTIVGNSFQGTYTGGEVLDSATGTRIISNSGATSNIGNLRGPSVIFSNGGSVLAAGQFADLRIPYAGTIEAWMIMAGQSGSLSIDVRKATFGNTPASIAASAKPTLSSQSSASSSTLTGWTTSVAAGDVIRFYVESATTVTQATVELYIREAY